SLALRLVLALLLVLNGIGTVSAVARASSMHGGHPAVAVPAPAGHCADSPVPDHADHGVAASEACGDHADSGCCGSAACDCACTHAASSALLPSAVRPLAFERQAMPAADPSGHAAPALPLPIRPPIA